MFTWHDIMAQKKTFLRNIIERLFNFPLIILTLQAIPLTRDDCQEISQNRQLSPNSYE